MNTIVSDASMKRMFKIKSANGDSSFATNTIHTPVKNGNTHVNSNDGKEDIEMWMKTRNISSFGTPITYAASPDTLSSSLKINSVKDSNVDDTSASYSVRRKIRDQKRPGGGT